MMMKNAVGLTYNLQKNKKQFDWLPEDYNAEFDASALITNIARTFEARGFAVVRLGNVFEVLEKMSSLGDIDIVFNLAEGYFGRNREAQVPVILEMLGKPFVGSDGLTLALTLDKLMTKKILRAEGIPTPAFFEISRRRKLEHVPLKYPMIVKPRYEGSSKGITDNSIVSNKKALLRQSEHIIETYRQPALVEEFISGREFTVAVLGNNPAQALPPVQIKIDGKLDLGDFFYTAGRITSRGLRYICPAVISPSLEQKLKEISAATYTAVECRDFGRVDIRVDAEGTPYVLEINPLPSLSQSDVFLPIAKCMGLTWEEMIWRILEHALERYGMNNDRAAQMNVQPQTGIVTQVTA